LGFRTAAFSLVVATATLVCATTSASSPSRSPAWAKEFLSRWYAHFNASDASGIAAMFTLDARFGAERGRDAISSSLAADFSKTQYHCNGNYDDFRELGDLAVAWGHESCLETTRADGTSLRTYERWLLVFRRQPDGTWLLSEETYAATDSGGKFS